MFNTHTNLRNNSVKDVQVKTGRLLVEIFQCWELVECKFEQPIVSMNNTRRLLN